MLGRSSCSDDEDQITVLQGRTNLFPYGYVTISGTTISEPQVSPNFLSAEWTRTGDEITLDFNLNIPTLAAGTIAYHIALPRKIGLFHCGLCISPFVTAVANLITPGTEIGNVRAQVYGSSLSTDSVLGLTSQSILVLQLDFLGTPQNQKVSVSVRYNRDGIDGILLPDMSLI